MAAISREFQYLVGSRWHGARQFIETLQVVLVFQERAKPTCEDLLCIH